LAELRVGESVKVSYTQTDRGRRTEQTLGFGGATNKDVVGEEYGFFSDPLALFCEDLDSCVGGKSIIGGLLQFPLLRISVSPVKL